MTMGPEDQLRYLNEEFAIMQARLKTMQEEQSALHDRIRELWEDRDWWRAIAQNRIRDVLNGKTAKTIAKTMKPLRKRNPKQSKNFYVEPE